MGLDVQGMNVGDAILKDLTPAFLLKDLTPPLTLIALNEQY